MTERIILPKVFEDRDGKYPQYKGKPKISYSQITSFNSEEYRGDYIVQYFSGFKLDSGDFALYGSSCGEFIEHYAKNEIVKGCLSEEDIEILKTKVDYPDNCIYEDEIILDLGFAVLEGYCDRTWYKDGKNIELRDYKSLNLEKKKDYYASDDYDQTTIYSYKKEQEGYIVVNSEVFGLGRKGTTINGQGNFKMRLSGEVEIIPTPYTKERGEKVIEKVKNTVKEISEYYVIYLKYFVAL